MRVRALVAMEDLAGALADLARLKGLDHDEEWADVTEAWCRKRLDDLPGAVACMERLIDRGRSPIGHFNLGCYLALMGEAERIVKTYIEYPPRPTQSESYAGPITLSNYHRFKYVRDELEKQGFKLGLPTGN